MLCREIIDVIEGTYPKEAALAWDNVGLLVGRTEKEVKRIYVALDATDEIIEAAIRGNADMLVTHHPLIFSPLKTVTDEHFISNRVVKLLQHDISYYAHELRCAWHGGAVGKNDGTCAGGAFGGDDSGK